MSKPFLLGVSGDLGSFSEEAARIYAKSRSINITLEYLIDMEGVLAAVENKQVSLGIFPVVNVHGGLVRMAYDAMGNHKFKVIDELWIEIHQCLLVKPGVQINQIKQIVTHSQAILQCRQYLEKNLKHIQCIEWQDTAKAAKELSQDKLDATTAVIASARAACIYELEVIAKNIQDIKPNLTAFLVVKNHGDL